MSQDSKNKVFITWTQVDEMVSILTEKIIASPIKIKAIIGIPRGGLIPAVMLSHKLSIPLMSESEWRSSPIEAKETLIVDDICDTGKTFLDWRTIDYDFVSAVLIQKHEDIAKVQATFHARFMDYHELHDWIVFPWEEPTSETIQDYKKA